MLLQRPPEYYNRGGAGELSAGHASFLKKKSGAAKKAVANRAKSSERKERPESSEKELRASSPSAVVRLAATNPNAAAVCRGAWTRVTIEQFRHLALRNFYGHIDTLSWP